MGYPCNSLIASAILWKNPGILKEEFCELLDATHSSDIKQYQRLEAWDFYDPRLEDRKFHNGIEGIAEILRIGNSDEYKKLSKGTTDEHGIEVSAPYMEVLSEDRAKQTGYQHRVIIHERNALQEERRVTQVSIGVLETGSVWKEINLGEERGLVTNIFSNKFVGTTKDDLTSRTLEMREYDMNIRPIIGEYREELYTSKEELWKNWLRFDPKNKYNWRKENGNFYAGPFGGDYFLWKKEGEKYYFDEKSFDIMPASIRCGGTGYTDLVLTYEAIKHEAWKLLSYKGFNHLDDFLKKFPHAKEAYDKAVWDSHMSLHAKKKKLTLSELMRLRLYPF